MRALSNRPWFALSCGIHEARTKHAECPWCAEAARELEMELAAPITGIQKRAATARASVAIVGREHTDPQLWLESASRAVKKLFAELQPHATAVLAVYEPRKRRVWPEAIKRLANELREKHRVPIQQIAAVTGLSYQMLYNQMNIKPSRAYALSRKRNTDPRIERTRSVA